MIHMGPCGNTNPCCSNTTVPDMASSSNLDLNITMGWGGSAGFLEKLGPSSSMVPRLQMAQVMARFPDSHMAFGGNRSLWNQYRSCCSRARDPNVVPSHSLDQMSPWFLVAAQATQISMALVAAWSSKTNMASSVSSDPGSLYNLWWNRSNGHHHRHWVW